MLYNTLRQYEYILAVAQTGSLTDAAAQLNVSQPSLSVAISRVEDTLGQPIFVRRKGAAIKITPFGHRFINEAQRLVALAQSIETGVDRSRTFVLGCFDDIAPWYLAPTLKHLQNSFADITFQGREGGFANLATDLNEGRIDLALSYDVGFDDRFQRRSLRSIAPTVFLSNGHTLTRNDHITLQQLEDHPLILSSEGLSESFVKRIFERLGLSPNIAIRAASLESMRSLAAHGMGVGLSYTCPPTDTSYDGCPLQTRPVSSPEAVADIALIWSRLRQEDPVFRQISDQIAAL